MNKPAFEFRNYDVEVTVDGHDFTMDCSSDTGDFLKELSDNLNKLGNEIAAGNKTKEDAIAYGMSSIDHLLGDGASETIFSTTKATLSRVSDVCIFLAETAADYSVAKRLEIANRAQRRAAAKKK